MSCVRNSNILFVQGLMLNEKKLKILSYVESRMSFIAPNLSAIVGPTVATKLMGTAISCCCVPACKHCGFVGQLCPLHVISMQEKQESRVNSDVSQFKDQHITGNVYHGLKPNQKCGMSILH